MTNSVSSLLLKVTPPCRDDLPEIVPSFKDMKWTVINFRVSLPKSLSTQRTAEKPQDFRPLLPLHLKKTSNAHDAVHANRVLASVLPGLFVGARGEIASTVKVLSAQYEV